MVDQLADVQRAPQRRLRAEQAAFNREAAALSSLSTALESLLTKAKALSGAQLYDARGVSLTDKSVASASVGANANGGSYVFEFAQLATMSAQRGGNNAGQGIDANADINSAAAGFSVSVTTGHFTVNGKQIDVQAGDTLNTVLGRVGVQTGLSATYDSATDKVSFSDGAGNPIVLGSAGDTSNFLQTARLVNNGTNTITSSSRLGGVNVSASLASARFNTTVTSGTFAINGVTISIDASNSSVNDVLNAINQSAAGVTASHDSVNDRFSLTNKVTGNIGISLSEGTSNFLSAAKLTASGGATFVSGQDAQFTVNGGSLLTSHTNTVTADSHGVAGLTVEALTTGRTTISVTNDTSGLKQAITDFVDQYNKVQGLIAIQTASSTDPKGVVTAGLLADDTQVSESSRKLRSLLTSDAFGLSGTIQRLESLGFKTDGYSNEITLQNPGTLDGALANSIADVRALFADQSRGIATRVGSYLDNLVGVDGSLWRHRDAVAGQSAKIDEQVSAMEKTVLGHRDVLLESFRSMELTLAQINRQAAFFSQRFGVT